MITKITIIIIIVLNSSYHKRSQKLIFPYNRKRSRSRPWPHISVTGNVKYTSTVVMCRERIADTEKKLSAEEFILSFQSLEMATASCCYVAKFALRIHNLEMKILAYFSPTVSSFVHVLGIHWIIKAFIPRNLLHKVLITNTAFKLHQVVCNEMLRHPIFEFLVLYFTFRSLIFAFHTILDTISLKI